MNKFSIALLLLVIFIPIFINAQSNTENAAFGNADTKYSGQQVIVTDFFEGRYRLHDYTRAREGIITKICNGEPTDPLVDIFDDDNNWTALEYDELSLVRSALEIHWGAEITYDYFKEIHGRDSWDGNSRAIQLCVTNRSDRITATSYGTDLNCDSVIYVEHGFRENAFIDIVAHEIGHAINAATSCLKPSREPGAISEGLCDIWGVCVKQFVKPSSDIWKQNPQINSFYVQNFENPKERNRPDTYLGEFWRDTDCENNIGQDGCWVHTNSGVISHWFYLLSEGSAQTDEINDNGAIFQVNGIGIHKAAKIVYRLQTVYLTRTSEFMDARNFGIQAAEDLFGAGSPEHIATQNAFYAVGLGEAYQAECGAIDINTTSNSILVQNLIAPIEIIKVYAPDNSLIFECNNNCGTSLEIPNLNEGIYRFDIQTFTENWQSICALTKLAEVGTMNNPCENLGEDSDGDGVCNEADCMPNDPDFPAEPNSICDDLNPLTKNDKVTEDGCDCIGTPIDGGTANCDALQFTSENNQITVSSLSSQSTIEIMGKNTNWQIMAICDGDCSEIQTIPDLMAGAYTVKVNLSGSDGSHCYREEKVSVSGGSNTGGKADCDNLTFIGKNGQITVSGLTASYDKVEIIGKNTDWQVLTICDGDCSDTQIIPDLKAGDYAVKVNQGGNDGTYCYREERVTVGSSNTSGSADCNNLMFTAGDGAITVSNLTASYDKVEIIGRNTDWQVVTICDGDCSDTQIIPDLAIGEYAVKVNQGGNDGTYCYREEMVTVTSSSNRNSAIDYTKELVLYPNPARNSLYLKLQSLSQSEGRIQIFNVFGQKVADFPKMQVADDALLIDLNGYENGMYLLSVQVDDLPVMTKRFVVEHLR